MRVRLVLSAAIFLLSTSFSPKAAEADSMIDVGKGDVQVQADRLEVDVTAGTALLTGQVVLVKGDLNVRCPKFELKFDSAPHLTWAKGSGGVVADVRGVHGEAPEIELDLANHTVELRGGVRLARGQGWIQADKATIDLSTGKVVATQVKGSIPVPK